MKPEQIPELDELHLWKLFRSARSASNGVSIIGPSECGRDLPGFGLPSIRQKLQVYNIIEFKHYKFKII